MTRELKYRGSGSDLATDVLLALDANELPRFLAKLKTLVVQERRDAFNSAIAITNELAVFIQSGKSSCDCAPGITCFGHQILGELRQHLLVLIAQDGVE